MGVWTPPPRATASEGQVQGGGRVQAADAAHSPVAFPRLPQDPQNTSTPPGLEEGLSLSLCL